MSKTLVTFLCSSLVALLCSSSLAQAQAARHSAASDPDMKELASYTLTMDGLARMDRVNKAMFAAMQKDPKYAERIKLGKELADLKKKDETTEAEDKRIEQIEARIEQLDESNSSADTSDAQTLGDMEKKIASIPFMSAALKQEGVSPREYAKFTMAMLQASFGLMAKQMSAKAGKPFQAPDGVNPANITFVEQHQAELKKLQDSYAQMSGVK